MIKTMEIKNFKSIKQLKLDCKRINVFIGEPNTGKSNILETLGIFSFAQYHHNASFVDFVRFERMSDLFYDGTVTEPVSAKFDDMELILEFKPGYFEGKISDKGSLIVSLGGGHDNLTVSSAEQERLRAFKFYKFSMQREFPGREIEFLLPLFGQNLMSVILTHKELRSLANNIFSKFGFELYLKLQENRIEIVKRSKEGITVSYPYSLTSDTLQRTIFYLCAILSNKDSILVFEEPESHSFPYYTKYLAEIIALDDRNNQYFMSTHNPYLLLPLLEKAPKDDIAVFITDFKDYQTKVKHLKAKGKIEILEKGIDVFANLDRYL